MKGFDNGAVLKSHMQEGEQVLWEGKPHLLFFILNANHISTIVGVVVILAGFVTVVNENFGGLVVMLIGLCIALAMSVYRFIVWKTIFYAITADKIFTIEGFISSAPMVIAINTLAKQSVENNFIETITGGIVGTIVLTQMPPAGQITFAKPATLLLKEIARPREVGRFIVIPEQNANMQPPQMPGFVVPTMPTVETTQNVTTSYSTSTTEYSS